MTRDEVMAKLEGWANPKMREINIKNGASENHFGVNLSQIRGLAKEIKADPDLARELWETGNVDAQILATLLFKPKLLSGEEIDALVRQSTYFKITDWLLVNILKHSQHKETLWKPWYESDDELVARAGWSLMSERVRNGEAENVEGLVNTIEAKLKTAPFRTQESMNYTLVEIAVCHPELRQRCLDIAERLQVFKDWPVAKGCLSPFAPVWIDYLLTERATP